MKRNASKAWIVNLVEHGLLPALFYFLSFCLLTWPLIREFSARFFTDDGDGFMNVWNLWWVNTAISQPSVHPSIWHTDMLHLPFGVTLLGQTLNPFNGLLAVPWLRFMSLAQAHNTIVLFSFVMSGVTAYWLAYYLTRSFWGSLLAGYVFTFSSYHFAHYYGHLNLISMEWIPLFVLCWYVLITRPTVWMGIASALTLWLVLLCDYYYFLYCFLIGILVVLWRMVAQRDFRFLLDREYRSPLAIFVLMSLLLTGPIILPLMYLLRTDPLLDAHNPVSFSLDLFALFVPGETWRFGRLTEGYWSKLPLGVSETSVHLGYAVLALLAYLWVKRRDVKDTGIGGINLWYFLAAFFFLLALGPALRINGRIVYESLMPYTLLETILPFMKLSGVPVRMVVMVTLSASVLCAMAIALLMRTARGRLFAFLLVALLVIEYLPGALPATPMGVLNYVTALADLPDNGGVLDLAAPTKYLQLYYQAAHRKPMAFGYVARTPSSVAEKEKGLNRAINRGEYATLWDAYRIRYIATADVIEYDNPYVSVELIYRDEETNIYRLECKCENEE